MIRRSSIFLGFLSFVTLFTVPVFSADYPAMGGFYGPHHYGMYGGDNSGRSDEALQRHLSEVLKSIASIEKRLAATSPCSEDEHDSLVDSIKEEEALLKNLETKHRALLGQYAAFEMTTPDAVGAGAGAGEGAGVGAHRLDDGHIVELDRQRRALAGVIAECEKRLSNMRSTASAYTEHEGRNETALRRQLAKLRKEADDLSKKLNGRMDAIGAAAVYGLAGQDAMWAFRNVKIRDWKEGIAAGLSYRLFEAVGLKVKETAQNQVSDIWDTVFGGMLRAARHKLQSGWYWVFNGGKWPFSPELIETWKVKICDIIFKDLLDKAKRAEAEGSDGGNANMRALFNESDKDDEEEQDSPQRDQVWTLMAQSYANMIDFVVLRIEGFKPFYFAPEKGYMGIECEIISLADELQNNLLIFKDNVLLKAESLKEMATGDLKHLLPIMKNNLANSFTALSDAVSHYHGMNTSYGKVSSSRESKSQRSPSFGGLSGMAGL